MADLLDPAQLSQIFSVLANNMSLAKQIASSANVPIDSLMKTLEKGPALAKNMASSLGTFTSSIKEAGANTINFKAILSSVYDELAKAGSNRELQISLTGIASSALLATTNIFNIKEALAGFQSSANSADASAISFASSISGIAVKLAEAVGAANTFENAILGAAISGGNFYDIIGKNAGNLSDSLTAATVDISKNAGDSAKILGISYNEALQRISQTAGTLPGTFKESFNMVDSVVDSTKTNTYTVMEALSQVARGTGQDFKTVIPIAKDLIEKFGKTGQDGAERIALLAKAAKDTGIGVGDLNDLAKTVNDRFAMWGDQMNGTVSVLGRISEAMKGTGVGIKGQIELVRSLELGFQNMTLPMRSFIAVASGMRSAGGAIGGGLQVEKMLQEGNISGLVDMMQSALTKKTGASKVMTLQEATEQPGREREFLIQRQLLSQMSGVADTGTLNRLMEAMSKGAVGGVGVAKDEATRTLTEALSAGKQLTESQTNYAAQELEVSREQAGHLKSIDTKLDMLNLNSKIGFGKEYTDALSAQKNAAMAFEKRPAGPREKEEMQKDINAGLRDKLADILGKAESYKAAITESGIGKKADQMLNLSEIEKQRRELEDKRQRGEQLTPVETKKFIELQNKETEIRSIPLAEKESRMSPFGVSRAELAPSRGFNIGTEETTAPPIRFEPIEIKLTIVGGGEGEAAKVIGDLTSKLKEIRTI